MELESLVKKLAAEILLELKGAPDSNRETVVIFAKPDEVCGGKVEPVIKSGARILFLEDAWQQQTVDRFILPFMSLNQMGDLSRGMARGRVAGMVLDTVLKGHTVEVAAYGYEHYMETAPEPLIKLYEKQKAVLTGFGIKPLEERRQSLRITDRALITEKDVRQALGQGVQRLRVGTSACVTPLAADLARENKIEILKE